MCKSRQQMRLYQNLEDRTTNDLHMLLDLVKVNDSLTAEEQSENIKLIESELRSRNAEETAHTQAHEQQADLDDVS